LKSSNIELYQFYPIKMKAKQGFHPCFYLRLDKNRHANCAATINALKFLHVSVMLKY